MIRRLAIAAALLWSRAVAAQDPAVIRVEDAGPGVGPAILTRALSLPHTIVPPATTRFLITRETDHPRTMIVLGRDVVVEGKVRGDVIVVSGDLYMHPGGSITGRAISFGGGVYESMLATIGGGATTFRNLTYDITPAADGFSLRYRELFPVAERTFALPGIFGFAIPTYDRSNGLSIGVGPRYTPPGTGLALEPRITYRSQLGQLDPSLEAIWLKDRRTELRARVGRFTESNDRWIRSNLINSALFLLNGADTRNYYRSTGGEVTAHRMWESPTGLLEPYVGASYERASSLRPGLGATGGPWTLLKKSDDERTHRLRPNPPIDDAKRIASAIAGAVWSWADQDMLAKAVVDGEAGSGFAQLTFDGRVEFPTFSTHRLGVEGHFVTTAGKTPRQRFAYIGGPGSLPLLDMLAEGGDQLLFVEGSYVIPIDRVTLPFVGSPTVTLKEILGGARAGGFPTIHQATGFRLAAGPVYLELLIDPVSRKTHTGYGLSLIP